MLEVTYINPDKRIVIKMYHFSAFITVCCPKKLGSSKTFRDVSECINYVKSMYDIEV